MDCSLKNNELQLKQFKNQNPVDTVTYHFTKKENLNSILENKSKVHKISKGITKYFNKQILAGVYQNSKSKETVVFKENGELVNFLGFDKYEIRNYFGTFHPHKNLDVITFTNSKQKTLKQFNWKFEKQKLFLTEFVDETIIDSKGNKQMTECCALGKNKIELILIEKY